MNNLENATLTWNPSLNTVPSSYTSLYNDISTTKKLPLNKEYWYFLWSFLVQFVSFFPLSTKPIMDLYPIVAAMSVGHQFCLAQILLGNCYHVMRKMILVEPFQKMAESCCLIHLWLFQYFLALRASSFCLGLIEFFAWSSDWSRYFLDEYDGSSRLL